MQKIYKLLGFTYLIAEIIHYYKLLGRFNYFNTLRIASNEDEICEIHDTINFDINGRASIMSKFYDTDVIKFHSVTNETTCNNKIKVGTSELYWRYWPFFMEFLFTTVRKIGECNLRRLGYTRKQYDTVDGYYNIWSKYVENTNPSLFFPGLGFGSVQYANALEYMERTTHIIEVPNLGYATPYSDGQATAQTIYDVINRIEDKPTDIIAHSLGTLHCAHYINECVKQHDNTSKNVILLDGFSSRHDILNSHILPFLSYNEYSNFVSIKNTQTKPGMLLYMGMVYFLFSNLDVQAFCKRYHTIYSGVLWREYKNIKIKYIFSGNEILTDTRYIISQMDKNDYYFIENGYHGSCMFGRKKNISFDIIKKWLQ